MDPVNRRISLIVSTALAMFMFADGLAQPAASAHAFPVTSLIEYGIPFRVPGSSLAYGFELANPGQAALTRQPRATLGGRQCEAMSAQAVAGTTARGGAMVPATLARLTQASEVVVVGTVTGFRGCLDADTDSIVTEITLAIERGVKALAAPATELTFEVPGGRYGGYRLAVGTSPEFAAGERVVVFLRRIAGGALRLTEDHQGKFNVTPGGIVAPIGLSLDAFAVLVERAEIGTLPTSADPLAAGPIHAVQSAYVTFGSWAAANIPVSYFINSSANRPAQFSAMQTENAFNGAFGTWQNDPGSTIAFTFAANTTRLSGADGCPGFDGNNDLTWGIADSGHSAGTLAITYACLDGMNNLVDADIEFDTDHYGANWRVDGSGACATGLFDLETVALHEEGHFIGLGHPSGSTCTINSNGNCPVMNALYAGVQRSLCQDDRSGATALYGGGPPAVGGVAEESDASVLAAAQDESSGYDATLYGAGAAVLAPIVALAAVRLWAKRRHVRRPGMGR